MFNPFPDLAASASRFAANFTDSMNGRGDGHGSSGADTRRTFGSQRPEGTRVPTHQAKKAPPASDRAIRNLALVKVTADDLLEETNKECLICLEEQKMGSFACKLACGHLYHKQCLTEWLQKHCSCESMMLYGHILVEAPIPEILMSIPSLTNLQLS
jgi:Ring finger domain